LSQKQLFLRRSLFPRFRADQKRAEILLLLELIAREPPRFIFEIGSAQCGTLFLLARVYAPKARIISIGLRISRVRSLIHERIAGRKQRVFCIRGDSGSLKTIERVKAILGRKELDCLFVDGDYSLSGVAADFQNYSPLVRLGGIIAFHDIVPDHGARFGAQTQAYTRAVPTSWSTLSLNFKSKPFVENADQDVYGLGVMFR